MGNRRILENLQQLLAAGVEVTVRACPRPGRQRRRREPGRARGFAAAQPRVRRFELLPYHPLGVHKYAALDLAPPQLEHPEPERLAAVAADVARLAPGVECRVVKGLG